MMMDWRFLRSRYKVLEWMGRAEPCRPPVGTMVRLLRRANLIAETTSCSVFGEMIIAGGPSMKESDQRARSSGAEAEGSGMVKGQARRFVPLSWGSAMMSSGLLLIRG